MWGCVAACTANSFDVIKVNVLFRFVNKGGSVTVLMPAKNLGHDDARVRHSLNEVVDRTFLSGIRIPAELTKEPLFFFSSHQTVLPGFFIISQRGIA